MKYGKIVDGKIIFSQESIAVDNMGDDFEINKTKMLEQGYKPIKELENKYLYRDCEGEYTFDFVDRGNYIEEIAVFTRYPEETLNKIIKDRRQVAYSQNTDPAILRRIRKQTLGTWTTADEIDFVAFIKQKSYDIDAGNPYIETEGGVKDGLQN